MRLTSTITSIFTALLFLTQAYAVEWTRVVGSDSPGVIIIGESPECWFSPSHYYVESPASLSISGITYNGLVQVTGRYVSGTGNGHPIQSHVYGAIYNGLAQVTKFDEIRYYPESGNTYCISVSNVVYDGLGNVLDGYDVNVTAPEAPIGRYNLVLFGSDHASEFTVGIGYVDFYCDASHAGQITEVSQGQSTGEAFDVGPVSGTYSVDPNGRLTLGNYSNGYISTDSSLIVWAPVPGDVQYEETGINVGIKAASTQISEHVPYMEIATSYDYGNGSGSVQLYEFNVSLSVDNGVSSVRMTSPDGNSYDLLKVVDDGDIWFEYYVHSPSLSGIADFGDGTYTFDVSYSGGGSDTTTVEYTLPDGNPIPPVTQKPELLYPTDGSVNIPPTLTFEFVAAQDRNWKIGLAWEATDGSTDGSIGGIAYDATSYGPVALSANTQYEVEMTINRVVRGTNSDGIEFVFDKDAEIEIGFTTGGITGDFCGANSNQPDGYVDYWDLLYFAQRWHTRPSDNNWDSRCDLDKEDSYVDYWDLLVFAQQWHKGVKP